MTSAAQCAAAVYIASAASKSWAEADGRKGALPHSLYTMDSHCGTLSFRTHPRPLCFAAFIHDAVHTGVPCAVPSLQKALVTPGRHCTSCFAALSARGGNPAAGHVTSTNDGEPTRLFFLSLLTSSQPPPLSRFFSLIRARTSSLRKTTTSTSQTRSTSTECPDNNASDSRWR